MTHSGRRTPVDVGLALALLGVLASSLLNWFFSGLTFFGELLDADDYRSMALGFGIAAVLLLVGLVPVHRLRASTWVGVLAVLLAMLCGFLALATWSQVAGAAPAEYPEPWAALQTMAWLPTSWPLLLLVVASPFLRSRTTMTSGVRGPSSPPPR